MSYIKIDNPIQRDFAMVPNVLWAWPGLSFKAKGFFAFLLSFRHGVCPPVAAMEAQTGLGRDARKAVMRELEAAALARWVVQRDRSGRVVAKFLEVTTRPLLAAIAAADVEGAGELHTPENPSHGRNVHTPENPSDGKAGAQRLKIRTSATENQAIKEREKEEKRARASAARQAARSASSRGETSRAAGAGREGGPVPLAQPEARAQRAAVAAALGLPVRDPRSGEWVRPVPAAQSAEKIGGAL